MFGMVATGMIMFMSWHDVHGDTMIARRHMCLRNAQRKYFLPREMLSPKVVACARARSRAVGVLLSLPHPCRPLPTLATCRWLWRCLFLLSFYYRRESRVPFPDSRISRQTDKEETNTVQVTSRPDLRLSEVVKRVLKVDVGANTLTQRPVVNSCKLQETARSTNPLKSNDNP